MGAFLVNFHVRTSDVAGIDELLAGLGGGTRRSEPAGEWVSVYEARASSQDPEWIAELACRLSAAAGAATVAFLVHDSDLAQCWLAADGVVQTHFDSWPGFPDDEPEPHLDHPEPLLALCDDLDLDGMRALFARDLVFAEELVQVLATHLGIPTERAMADFGHYDDEPNLGIDDITAMFAQHLPAFANDATAEAGELVEAAHRGDTDGVRALLDAGAAVDVIAPWRPEATRSGPMAGISVEIGATPLFAAASQNQPQVIRLLLERGADPDTGIPQGSSPLAAAACAGHVAAVEALLTGGADPFVRDAVGMTAAEALAAERQQLAMITEAMSALPAAPDLPVALPDDAALEACGRLLDDAASAR